MHSQDLLTPAMLRKLLTYDPDTGLLYWRVRTPDMFTDGKQTAAHNCARWNARFAGTEAFTSVSNKRYKHGRILGKHYFAHRVIWAMANGRWPDNHIDHINGICNDNRICNLRDVTRSVNARNAKKKINNTSGICGVSWHKKNQKWQANITMRGKSVNLGYFENIECATAARKAAEIGNGYTARHGQ
jgi:hypothetical protein